MKSPAPQGARTAKTAPAWNPLPTIPEDRELSLPAPGPRVNGRHPLVRALRRTDPERIDRLIGNEDTLAMLARNPGLFRALRAALPHVEAGLTDRQRAIIQANTPTPRTPAGPHGMPVQSQAPAAAARPLSPEQKAEWEWVERHLLPITPEIRNDILRNVGRDVARRHGLPIPADLDAFVRANPEAVNARLREVEAQGKSPRALYVPAMSPANAPAHRFLKFLGTLPDPAQDPEAIQRMWGGNQGKASGAAAPLTHEERQRMDQALRMMEMLNQGNQSDPRAPRR